MLNLDAGTRYGLVVGVSLIGMWVLPGLWQESRRPLSTAATAIETPSIAGIPQQLALHKRDIKAQLAFDIATLQTQQDCVSTANSQGALAQCQQAADAARAQHQQVGRQNGQKE